MKIIILCSSIRSSVSIHDERQRVRNLKARLHFAVYLPGEFDRQGPYFFFKNFIKPFTLSHCHHVFPVSNGAWGKRQQREVRRRHLSEAGLSPERSTLRKPFQASLASLCCWTYKQGFVCSLENTYLNVSAPSPLIARDFLLLCTSERFSIAKEPKDAMYWPSEQLAEVACAHTM